MLIKLRWSLLQKQYYDRLSAAKGSVPFLSSINNIARWSCFNYHCELNQHFIFAIVNRSLGAVIEASLFFFQTQCSLMTFIFRKILCAFVFWKQQGFDTSCGVSHFCRSLLIGCPEMWKGQRTWKVAAVQSRSIAYLCINAPNVRHLFFGAKPFLAAWMHCSRTLQLFGLVCTA